MTLGIITSTIPKIKTIIIIIIMTLGLITSTIPKIKTIIIIIIMTLQLPLWIDAAFSAS
jgi:hypothetical protein